VSTPIPSLETRKAVSASRYRVIAKLGQGGMADVFLAIQSGMTGFRRLAVVKRLRPDIAGDDDSLSMFLEEARLAARLNHPNVVHTYEVGHDGDSHFIAMEFLRGHSYWHLLKRVGRDKLDFAISVRILIEALKGLEYAHQLRDFDGTFLNVVHRDVSPSNIFITYDGHIKILDFGIAKALNSSIETKSGVLKGKIAYMSPEQASGTDIGGQSDLYAVGVLLWEAAAKARRWPKIPEVNILTKLIAREAPVPPQAERFGLPPEVDEVCLRALASDPGERFASAGEFRAALEELLEAMGRDVSAEDVGRYLSQCFQDENQKLQALIEEKTKQADDEADLTVASLISLNEPGSASRARVLEDKPEVGGSDRTDAARDAASSGVRERAPGSKRSIAVVLLLAAVLGVGVFIGRRALTTPAPQPSASAPVARAPVTVRVSAQPAGAKLYWDGRLLDSNPYSETRPPSRETITLRAEAEGHTAQSAIVSLDADRDVSFTLEALPAPAPLTLDLDEVAARPGQQPKAGAGPAQSARPKPKPKSKVKLDTSNPWAD